MLPQPPSPALSPRASAPLAAASRMSPSLSSDLPARGRSLSYQDLSRCFHLPINSAARELGVCVTALKKQCRRHGVPRWPHRKLKSLDKLKERLEKEEATAADKEYYKHEIHSIVQKKHHIFRATPSSRDHPSDSHPSDHPNSSSHSLVDPRTHSSSRPPHPSFSHEHPPPPHHPHTPVLMVSNPPPLPHHLPHSLPPPQSLAPVPIPMSSVSFCGAMGCDCCVNGGVSSQGYHLPFVRQPMPPASSNSSRAPQKPQPNPSGPVPSPGPPQFYGIPPSQYPYVSYPPQPPQPQPQPQLQPQPQPQPPQPPFHNMVQVNVLEQQPYPHPVMAAPGQPPQAITAPQSAQGVASGGNGSPNLIQAGPMLPHSSAMTAPITAAVQQQQQPQSQPQPQFEVYSGQGPPGQAQNGFVYGGFPAQAPMPMDGMVQATQSKPATPQMVPYYWTELSHSANPNNLVTMYNQTTHYHHHHAAESAANGHSVAGGMVDGTASSATNNSDAADWRRNALHMRPKDTSGMPANSTVTGSRVTGPRKQDTSRVAIPPRPTSAPAASSAAAATAAKPTPTNNTSANNRNPTSNGIVRKDGNDLNAAGKDVITAKAAKHTPRTNGRVEEEKTDCKKSSSDTRNTSTRVSRNGPGRSGAKDTDRTAVLPTSPRDTNGAVSRHESSKLNSPKPSKTSDVVRTPELDISNRGQPKHRGQALKPVMQTKNVSHPKLRTGAPFRHTGHGHDRHAAHDRRRVTGKSVTSRSPNKRPRRAMGTMHGWGPLYISAGNTGLPLPLHHEREVTRRVREITPPSDREESPGDPDTGEGSGSGSGTGTGSGSGDGTGSGSGDGSGSRSGGGSRGICDDRRAVQGEKGALSREARVRGRKQERMDPPSPSTGSIAKRRKSGNGHSGNGHIVNAWRLAGAVGGEDGAGTGLVGPGREGASSTAVRARRYEQVVHQSVALGCAQWSVDKSTRLTSSMGSKALLGVLGVSGLGSEGGADTVEGMRGRYTAALRGQRTEWIARQGKKRFLVVVAPFKKRGCAEISGACGVIVEMTGSAVSR
ncbi:unnamed protein product [Chondrus crispus]|uniref:RWP-RK domain-containing protein n=1 Tax=Chondrus crispus TaxID=2769 RepID=R7QHE9_CHOCR|nr:unnamed protein product [Chondrus crispus]CDF37947.1 unnamed protein product [Chondrus crispus]|eukprot:XP_005717816.1 unnamed protein product [Chondrus crispus]